MAYVVLDHFHDSDAGVYRLTIGEPVEVEVSLEDPPEDGPQTATRIAGYTNVADYVFSDADPRWFKKGVRVGDDAAAEAQRSDVLAALEARAHAATAPDRTPRQLPGVGDLL